MKTLDFLPQKYRDKTARQRAGLWRLLVVALLGGVVAAASMGQLWHRNHVRQQLDELQPLYADAQAKQAMLTHMQAELTHETAAATLYAHLQTPWPRTQLVAAVTLPVSEGLRIEQMHVVEMETPASAALASAAESAAPSLESMSPATRDLAAIRTAGTARVTQAEIVGTCQHAGAVHDYLGRIEKSPLVSRAELVSLENVTVEGKDRQLRFTAQVKLRPARGWSSRMAAEATAAAPTLTQTGRPTR